MDATDSEKGPETPSKELWDLSPSSKGRQRRKNPKYTDYETVDADDAQDAPQKRARRSCSDREASKSTPAASVKAEEATQPTDDEQPEPTDEAADGEIPEETPKKATRGKKTRAKKGRGRKKKAAAKKVVKAPPTDGSVPAGEGGALVENGTPKPKRKYVRKKIVQEVEPVPDPAEAATQPEGEVQPGGRRRRGAATAALKYLHILAKEVLGHSEESGSHREANNDVANTDPETKRKGPRRGRKRKRCGYDSDAPEDEDFVPDVNDDQEEEDMEMDHEEARYSGSDSDLDLWPSRRSSAAATIHFSRNSAGGAIRVRNGLTANAMKPVWDSIETNKKFREEHHSSWVFPEWVPSTCNWNQVPDSDLEKYLPQELQSAAFKVSREGVRPEETPLQTLHRFEAVPAHPDRWDMILHTGGPVWGLEWCPTPDGAPATQYLAVSCHREMDDQHFVQKIYEGTGLIQLWDLGKLEYNNRPDSEPALAYGLAQDKGFIWLLKWCPSGGWELPSCSRKAPFLPRLGLLAVATSTSVVTIYSLPHPAALETRPGDTLNRAANKLPLIYKAEGVLTLKLGSLKCPRHEKSGQVLSMDWLPGKPHNIMAVGFYDGVVGLWDLTTKSALLRVRESGGSLTLMPYRCFLAHDHAVRALAFCPANRHLMVTAGEDRLVKTWDLRRLDDPVTVQKRFLTNEVYWPLNAPGLLMAQENTYSVNGSHGIHYYDHYMRSIFAIPRMATMWSISYTDWLNSVVTSDTLGEVILALLPQVCYSPQYVKRTIDRRFPIYFTSMVPYDTSEERSPEEEQEEEQQQPEEEQEEEEQQDAVEEEEKGDEADCEERNESNNETRREGRKGRRDRNPPLVFPKYKDVVKKYYLHHTDSDMRTFEKSERRFCWKRMKDTEAKSLSNIDEMPLGALHKVRFSPNMKCHTWLATGGQTGLVRLNCVRSLISCHVKEMINENQAQFNALYSPDEQQEAEQSEAEAL